MATGRTSINHSRVYIDGYDMSGYTRSYGPLTWEFEPVDATCQLGDTIKGYLPGNETIGIGTVNSVIDPTATGIWVLSSSPNASRVVSIPMGIRAAPAAGDQVFVGRFIQTGFQGGEDGGLATVTIPFGAWDAGNLISFKRPWGALLHPTGAETAVNSGTGIDDYGASPPSYGGYMVYHLLAGAGTGTVIVKVQHASTNSDVSFADLTGATSGAIANTAIPTSGVVATATNLAVNRYLRWQIVFSGMTSVTFVLTFVRTRTVNLI